MPAPAAKDITRDDARAAYLASLFNMADFFMKSGYGMDGSIPSRNIVGDFSNAVLMRDMIEGVQEKARVFISKVVKDGEDPAQAIVGLDMLDRLAETFDLNPCLPRAAAAPSPAR